MKRRLDPVLIATQVVFILAIPVFAIIALLGMVIPALGRRMQQAAAQWRNERCEDDN